MSPQERKLSQGSEGGDAEWSISTSNHQQRHRSTRAFFRQRPPVVDESSQRDGASESIASDELPIPVNRNPPAMPLRDLFMNQNTAFQCPQPARAPMTMFELHSIVSDVINMLDDDDIFSEDQSNANIPVAGHFHQ